MVVEGQEGEVVAVVALVAPNPKQIGVATTDGCVADAVVATENLVADFLAVVAHVRRNWTMNHLR